LVLAAAVAGAQETAPRAWQQRLHTEIPVPVPLVPLESVNPFSTAVDTPPRLTAGEAPRKVPVSGRAIVAAYVDAKGQCLGAVPLELPFPGLTSGLVEELSATRFDPARSGTAAQPSWTVVEITIGGKVKESTVTDQNLELPDPSSPPKPNVPPPVSPSGNLVNLPYSSPAELTAVAIPRRLKVKVPSRETDILVRALVHVTVDGLPDRFVPLDLDPGFHAWFSTFLKSWRLEPAMRDGAPVDCWAIYSARATMRVSSLASTTFRAATDYSYSPSEIPPQ
jgi:hypothetical protein